MLKFVFLISISLVLINAGQNEMVFLDYNSLNKPKHNIYQIYIFWQNLNVGNKVGRTGGISNDEIPADSTIDSLLNKIKSQVLGNLTVNSNSLTPVSYKTQIVAGKNYFIKV